MQGVSEPAAQRGVIPRAFEHIFESIQVGEPVSVGQTCELTDLAQRLYVFNAQMFSEGFLFFKIFIHSILYTKFLIKNMCDSNQKSNSAFQRCGEPQLMYGLREGRSLFHTGPRRFGPEHLNLKTALCCYFC